MSNRSEKVRLSFYNRGSDEQSEIFPPTVSEIADAQRRDKRLRKYFKSGGEVPSNKYVLAYVDDTEVLVNKNSKMIVPKSLQKKVVEWHHHYLQHPGHDRLESTLNATMT